MTLELSAKYSGLSTPYLGAADTDIPAWLFTDAAKYRTGTVELSIDALWADCDYVFAKELVYGFSGTIVPVYKDVRKDVCWYHILPFVAVLTQKVDGSILKYTGKINGQPNSSVSLSWRSTGEFLTGLIAHDVTMLNSTYDYPATNDYFAGNKKGGIRRNTLFTQQSTSWGWQLYPAGEDSDAAPTRIVEVTSSTPPPAKPEPAAKPEKPSKPEKPEPEPKKPKIPWISKYRISPAGYLYFNPDAPANPLYRKAQTVIDNIKADWGGKLRTSVTMSIDPDHDAGPINLTGLNLNGKTLTIKGLRKGDEISKVGGILFPKTLHGGTVALDSLEISSTDSSCIDVDLDPNLYAKLNFNFNKLTFNNCAFKGISFQGGWNAASVDEPVSVKITDSKFNFSGVLTYDYLTYGIVRNTGTRNAISIVSPVAKLEILNNQFSYSLQDPANPPSKTVSAVWIASQNENVSVKWNFFDTPPNPKVVALQRSGGGGTFYGNISLGTFEFYSPDSFVTLARNTLISKNGPALRVKDSPDKPFLLAYHNIFGSGGIEIPIDKRIGAAEGNLFDLNSADLKSVLIKSNVDPKFSLSVNDFISEFNSPETEDNVFIPHFQERYLLSSDKPITAGHLNPAAIGLKLINSDRKEVAKIFNGFANLNLPAAPDPLLEYDSYSGRVVKKTTYKRKFEWEDQDIDGTQILDKEFGGYAGADGLLKKEITDAIKNSKPTVGVVVLGGTDATSAELGNVMDAYSDKLETAGMDVTSAVNFTLTTTAGSIPKAGKSLCGLVKELDGEGNLPEMLAVVTQGLGAYILYEAYQNGDADCKERLDRMHISYTMVERPNFDTFIISDLGKCVMSVGSIIPGISTPCEQANYSIGGESKVRFLRKVKGVFAADRDYPKYKFDSTDADLQKILDSSISSIKTIFGSTRLGTTQPIKSVLFVFMDGFMATKTVADMKKQFAALGSSFKGEALDYNENLSRTENAKRICDILTKPAYKTDSTVVVGFSAGAAAAGSLFEVCPATVKARTNLQVVMMEPFPLTRGLTTFGQVLAHGTGVGLLWPALPNVISSCDWVNCWMDKNLVNSTDVPMCACDTTAPLSDTQSYNTAIAQSIERAVSGGCLTDSNPDLLTCLPPEGMEDVSVRLWVSPGTHVPGAANIIDILRKVQNTLKPN